MSEQTIALVTGANKGIGYEIAAGLGALGWSVGVGARDERRREAAVEKLRAAGIDAFGVPLDVTDDASVAAAAAADRGPRRAARRAGQQRRRSPAVCRRSPPRSIRDRARRRGDQRDRRHPGHQRDAAAAAPLGVTADRQHVQQRRLARPADHPRHRARARFPPRTRRRRRSSTPSPSSTPRNWRDTNILINSGCPGFHRDRPQRLPRRPHPRAGRGDRDPPRHPARRRPDRRILRRRRRVPW